MCAAGTVDDVGFKSSDGFGYLCVSQGCRGF
jgi:hypothetical protein